MVRKNSKKLPPGTRIPDHVAIILDGNGRWARARGLPATQGHEAGAKALRELIDSSRDFGIHTLTLWGWSTENWKRPPMEAKKILGLVKWYLKKELKVAKKEGVRFCHFGRKDRLPKDLVNWLMKVEEETKDNSKFILNLALDYGGRDEILRAVRAIVRDKIKPEEINEDVFSSYLDTAGQPYPYPDLFIRTSGEQRTSGYLPWQMAYTEFYFEQVHLPDLNSDRLREAILDYSRRRRRFGAKDRIKHFKFRPEIAARLELNWWRLQNIPEGTRLRDYAIQHIKEQYGLSKSLAKKAAVHLIEASVLGRENKWRKSKSAMKNFYRLIKDEIKLAFEPSVAASLQVKLWKETTNREEVKEAEETARQLYAEVYRISLLQAAKLAHLRVLATVERNMAMRGHGDHHWEKAEDYLHKFYSALKERVA